MSTAKLHDDWIEFLRLLNANGARFVIVGAHAVAAHGRPRLTADLDILIDTTAGNAARVAHAISAFGFGDIDPSELTRPDKVIFMGREPFRIDVLTSIDGVRFETAWRNRLTSVLGGVPVAFLGRADLLRNKRAAGRPKDLLDVALLEESSAPKPRTATRHRRKPRPR